MHVYYYLSSAVYVSPPFPGPFQSSHHKRPQFFPGKWGKEARFHLIRVRKFAWNKMDPGNSEIITFHATETADDNNSAYRVQYLQQQFRRTDSLLQQRSSIMRQDFQDAVDGVDRECTSSPLRQSLSSSRCLSHVLCLDAHFRQ